MTEYWVSTKKHFCEVCQCWLSAHARNISEHERTEGHQINQQKLIRDMHAKERRKREETYALHAEILRVESAARKSFNEKDSGRRDENALRAKAFSALRPTAGATLIDEQPVKKQKIGQIVAAPQPYTTPLPINLEPISRDSVSDRSDSVKNSSETGFSCAVPQSVWMLSVDPETNTPYYFNTLTGETRHDDPSGDVAVVGGVYGAKGMTGREIMEHKTDAAIANLLPNVNELADAYRQHVLEQKSNTIADDTSKDSKMTTKKHQDKELIPSYASDAAYVESKKFRKSLAGYVFKMGPLGLGYYRDMKHQIEEKNKETKNEVPSSLLNFIIQQPIVAPVELTKPSSEEEATVSSEKQQSDQKETKIDEKTGVGEWEEVPISESRFGIPVVNSDQKSDNYQTEENENSEARDNISTSKENNEIDVITSKNDEEEGPSTATLLAALKEDADASQALNEDDLKRHNKQMLFLPLARSLEDTATTNKSAPVTFMKRTLLRGKPLRR